MLGHRELSADEYIGILRRRWWIILIPALLAPVIVYGISLKIPNRYVSQTLVLVQPQKVPDALVHPVVVEELQQRLATMTEQILSRTRLQPIIERFGVLKNEPISMEEKVERIRKQIQVTPLKEDVRGNTPGFYISFTAETPRMAHDVCSEITSMFTTENLKVREQAAVGTTEFISNQVAEAKRQLDEKDAKLAEFKRKYLGQLPGDEQQNFTMMSSANSQLDAVTQMLSRAQQDKTYLESLLAQQVAAWRSSQSTGSGSAPSATLEQQLATAQAQLIAMQSRYTPDHPDVVKLNNQIATLKQMIKDSDAQQSVKKEAPPEKASATEPIQIQQMRIQLHQLEQLVREKSAEQVRLQHEVGKYQARVQLSPLVEEEYKGLTRDYQSAQNFYTELLSKQQQSSMATDLEKRQQGETFMTMDQASMPEKPTFPDRQMFALAGLVGGLALGGGISLLLEMRDKSLRSERDVEFWLELPTLTTLPPMAGSAVSRGRFWSRGPKQPKPVAVTQSNVAEA